MATKPKKERAKTYEKKLAVNATFDEVVDIALSSSESKPKKQSAKKA